MNLEILVITAIPVVLVNMVIQVSLVILVNMVIW